MSSNGFVAPVQNVALPLAHEHAFGRATLISRVRVDGARPLGRPADDLDAALGGIIDEVPVAPKTPGRGVHDGHGDQLEPGR